MRQLLTATLIKCIAWLPFSVNQKLGSLLGWLLIVTRSRMYRSACRNISHCLPNLTEQEQKNLARRSCIETGKVATESFWIWSRPIKQVNQLITSVEGKEFIEQAISNEKPVLLTGAHLGNWELITIWSGMYFNTAAFYRSPKISALDKIMRKGREKTGARLLTGNKQSLKRIISHLKSGHLFVLISDQEPGKGAGVYAPFFERPAYTMTLVQRLQRLSDAKVLMFHIRRLKKGFEISISDPQINQFTAPEDEYATLLNNHLQKLIESNVEQFQWGYKRFKSPPDGDYDFYAE